MRRPRATTGVVAGLLLAGCSVDDGPGRDLDPANLAQVVPTDEPRSEYGNPASYSVHGQRYHVRDSARGYVAEGTASWYGRKFHGRRTSSGETFDMYAMTAAHRTLPLPSFARVTRLDTGRSTVVRINDRGPFVDDRLIDLSYAAATRLGVVERGTAPVRVRALTPGEPTGAVTADGAVFIQVGAFRERANAAQMRARIKRVADSDAVAINSVNTPAGKRLYRVRLGPLAPGAERRAMLDRLDQAGIAWFTEPVGRTPGE